MNMSELKPYTYIKCRHHVKYSTDKLRGGETYLFIGWITNPNYLGENAVLLDERGVFTAYLGEEDFEVR